MLTTSGNIPHADLEDGSLRPATYRDLVDMTKLSHSLGMHGSAPVRPLDLPPLLQELAMYFVHTTMRQRGDRGRPDIVGRARQIAQKRIAEHDYRLDADKGRDLEAIYQRARKEVG